MAAAIFAGIGAATGLFSGIFGASQASKQNAAAEKAYNKQLKQQRQIARETNKYQRQAFRDDKANFYIQRDYQYQQNVQNWQRQNEIQDYQYLQSLRQYQRDIQIRDQQLNFNDLAAQQAFANESAALAGIFTQQAFAREDQVMGLQKALTENALNRRTTQLEMQSVANKGIFGATEIQQNLKDYTEQVDFKKQSALVENIQAQGQNELRQAGGSFRKGQVSTMGDFYRGMSELSSALSGRQRQAALKMAELGVETSILEKKLGIQMEGIDNAAMSAVADAQFNMRVLDADIASAVAQSQRNMQQISLQKYGADLSAAAQVMIRPERLPYAPAPTIAPDRIWTRPMKVLPGAVAEPVQQNVWAPLVSGVTSAVGSIGDIYMAQYKANKPNTAGQFFQSGFLNTQGSLTGGAF